MTLNRLLLVASGMALPLLGAMNGLGAQSFVHYTYNVNASDLPTCRGFTGLHNAVWSRSDSKLDNLNVSYPIVLMLDSKSPAASAGLTIGDSIVAVNGQTTLGSSDPEFAMWKVEVAEPNVVKVKRGERELELLMYMGQWVKLPGDSTEFDGSSGTRSNRVCRSVP